jgi:hypothetical protein
MCQLEEPVRETTNAPIVTSINNAAGMVQNSIL